MATNSTKVCYTPNGAVWEGATPCNQTADESHCCGVNDFCLSNGHCLQAEGAYANRIGRGTCTDSSWRSEACPYECNDIRTDQDCALLLAYETPDGSFCCDRGFNTETQSCPTASGKFGTTPFNMTLGRVIWNRTDGSIMQNGTLLPSQVQLSEAQTTVTLRPSPSSSATSNSNDVTAVAAGIAVPLGILLLASLATIFFLWSKLKNLKKQIQKSDTPYDGASGYKPIDMHSLTPQNGAATDPYTALPKYQRDQYMHQAPVNEAPVERELVEADARMPVQELGT
ncbi:hypothetical protein M409DRAFT_48521 [Zasmidium cellare ATCC 36951]|uniref:Mid2 domain-containing protein n=1 Tax=Zasmidium cellare ATCC 36951 TaxID=1080233 RepID=A0A6A6D5B5_ZASCE|nr:uncharacterized protein M409DRAFT_48521 [Zasmidium cellare ATCC 36951]KAF2173560.1 hypothetical protein M409DRAFT_48521 [Zasmidium cellare ATCC 36951]